jgi:hypothetical protein
MKKDLNSNMMCQCVFTYALQYFLMACEFYLMVLRLNACSQRKYVRFFHMYVSDLFMSLVQD